MKEKALVTGGAGFIGSNLVDKLIEIGYEVVIVDNLLTGSKDNVNSLAVFYEKDIGDKRSIEEVFKIEKPNLVFHLAAGYLIHSIENPQRDARTNIIGTINIIELCLKYNVEKIIYSNSGGASYGEPEEIPIREDHPIHPLTPYGASKYSAEMYLYLYHKNKGLNYTALRYANIYGPRQNPNLEGGVVSIFVDAVLRDKNPLIFGDGKQTRDYCYVSDVVDANILAIEKGNAESYNVATGIELSVLDILDEVNKALKKESIPKFMLPREGDCKRAVFDIQKIEQDLGWGPKISIKEGIKKTIEWQKNKEQKQ